MKAFREVTYLPEFEKDLKKLAKKFKTIQEDLDNLIKYQLKLYHKIGTDNKGIFPISGLGTRCSQKIYKVKKFASRSIKGQGVHTGLRLIYTYYKDKDRVELIEIYFKGNKENEDKKRIRQYCTKVVEKLKKQ